MILRSYVKCLDQQGFHCGDGWVARFFLGENDLGRMGPKNDPDRAHGRTGGCNGDFMHLGACNGDFTVDVAGSPVFFLS